MITVRGVVLLDPAEAAEKTNRSERTIRRWIADGTLTPIRGMIRQDQLLQAEHAKWKNHGGKRASGQKTCYAERM